MSKFKVKVSRTWYTDSFYKIKYKNGGFFWKTIKSCEYDHMSESYLLSDLTIPINSVPYTISMFKSIDDVTRHNEFEKEKVRRRNLEIVLKRKEHKKLVKETLRKYK